ncbi:15181_t:CDS:1 [Dentiscutata heterogama]|uniref:15181_t:CDS:1 n=1 Tax=Dentiscutata heterogama TaxID=1316150 RepID=A0ACA9KY11_9GLOM|nr:15181_t:CDS:1 [Dentiscutata heterogama]
MTRAKYQRYLRSNDLTPKEELDNFLTKHIKYLQREKKRVEQFFKENGINGENLETNLEELEKIINERDELKERIDKLIEERNEFKKSIDKNKIIQIFAAQLIRNLHRERNQFKNLVEEHQQEITRLRDQNQRLSYHLEIARNFNGITIANQNIRIRN